MFHILALVLFWRTFRVGIKKKKICIKRDRLIERQRLKKSKPREPWRELKEKSRKNWPKKLKLRLVRMVKVNQMMTLRKRMEKRNLRVKKLLQLTQALKNLQLQRHQSL
jgi:hypothetical protein